jgi:hypothetical protein
MRQQARSAAFISALEAMQAIARASMTPAAGPAHRIGEISVPYTRLHLKDSRFAGLVEGDEMYSNVELAPWDPSYLPETWS